MQVNIYDLAYIVFVENREGLLNISVEIPVLQSNKERYFFYFELLCKGIVLLYGNNTNSVTLSELPEDAFNRIRKIMKFSNIHVHFVQMDIDTAILLDILQSEEDTVRDVCLSSNQKLQDAPNDLELHEYEYVIRLVNAVTIIQFHDE
jgi:hypothetical protein